ncbi:MAG: C40 family peptidase [Bacilli bacterium]|nr:C40 family peptidase [Bacilli bacterium]
MELFQMLDCNSVLGNCCSDPGLVSILDIVRKFLDLFQVFVPIMLIVGATISFIKLAANPEMKNGTKGIVNQFLAAIICFFIPVIVNFVMGITPETYELSACWEQAKTSNEIAKSMTNVYVDKNNKKKSSVLIDPKNYDPNNPSAGGGSTGSGNGSATGKAIVEYAKSFVGQPYVWGGTWNGELPYTGTDCSGFVQGVFKHHGINLTRTTYTQWGDTSTYTVVPPGAEIKAGDLVNYWEHVAILTGNGNEIVHAKGRNYGIVIDSDYKTASSHSIKGIMRIKGVN